MLRLDLSNSEALRRLYRDLSIGGGDALGAGGKKVLFTTADPQADGGGMGEDGLSQSGFPGRVSQHRQQVAGAALFHGAGQGVGVQSPFCQKTFASVGQGLWGHVVDVAHKLTDGTICATTALPQKDSDAVGPVKGLPAYTVAHTVRRHDGHGAKLLGERGQKGGTSGGAQLPQDLTAVSGYPGQKIGGGRGGYRHHPMGAAHGSAAHMHRGGGNLVRGEEPQGVTGTHYIGHSVQSPHLMVMDLSHRAAMCLGFRLGDGVIHIPGLGLHGLRQVHPIDEGADVVGRGVVMMVCVVMGVIVGVPVFVDVGGMLVVVFVTMIVVVVVGMVMIAVVLLTFVLLLTMDGHSHMSA